LLLKVTIIKKLEPFVSNKLNPTSKKEGSTKKNKQTQERRKNPKKKKRK